MNTKYENRLIGVWIELVVGGGGGEREERCR